MARGWESKSIEDQQADRLNADRRSVSVPGQAGDPAERARRRTLELARARMKADLAAATNAAHRSMLEAAIRALDELIDTPNGFTS